MRDETTLIQLAKDGDLEAFAELAERYRRMLYAAAYSVLRSSDEAEDVAQETICRIYARIQTLRESGSFGRWAYTIAKNAAIGRLRSRSREAPLEDVAQQPAGAEAGLAAELRHAVERLSDRLKEPLLMYYINGYSGKEVADFLGIAPGTVRARLTEARNALRKELVIVLRKTIQELVPSGELTAMLARLRTFPETAPDLSLVEVDAPVPDPEFVEGHWFFVPLKPGGGAFAAWYDYPERNLTDVMFGRVLGETEIEGQRCCEVLLSGSPGWGEENYRLCYWSADPEAVYMVANYHSTEDELKTWSDPNWDGDRRGYPRRPGTLTLLERVGEEEFVDPEGRRLAPVGAYDVTMNGRTQRCLRVIDPNPAQGCLVDAYINEQGRTVLFRRYNCLPHWSRQRPGFENSMGAVERLAELGNLRMVHNGIEFYHWYDCVTDVALGAG